ncbi:hypothetical protein FA15DRAFT_331172 [Coprinopsis marcescibilis]|uniref:Uncharacterized protein n=1 Tax=Coprinopsis marcescibilis TaxID=230819 RepID=A0A5C3KZH0_COPMA|nr:hypothetical protein FA15DRAFT_331172 [Coprinopsis marcescibilis]
MYGRIYRIFFNPSPQRKLPARSKCLLYNSHHAPALELAISQRFAMGRRLKHASSPVKTPDEPGAYTVGSTAYFFCNCSHRCRGRITRVSKTTYINHRKQALFLASLSKPSSAANQESGQNNPGATSQAAGYSNGQNNNPPLPNPHNSANATVSVTNSRHTAAPAGQNPQGAGSSRTASTNSTVPSQVAGNPPTAQRTAPQMMSNATTTAPPAPAAPVPRPYLLVFLDQIKAVLDYIDTVRSTSQTAKIRLSQSGLLEPVLASFDNKLGLPPVFSEITRNPDLRLSIEVYAGIRRDISTGSDNYAKTYEDIRAATTQRFGESNMLSLQDVERKMSEAIRVLG